MTKKKILIIGASGFLGYNLSLKLKKLGYSLFLLSRNKNKYLKISGASYIFCDISNKKKLQKKINRNFNFVINLSGNIDHNDKKNSKKIHFEGVKNIINILEKKKINLFIQIGSSLEYGKIKSPHKENNYCKPVSFYGKAKHLASKYLVKKKLLFKFIILRPYQIYGPYQKINRLIPHVVTSCLKDKSFDCSNGSQFRDFLYVEDFVDLVIKIINCKNNQSGVYNVGYGKPQKVKSVIQKIILILKKGKPNFGRIKMRPDEVKYLYPNIEKVRSIYKWSPKINLSQGLKKTIRYYKKNNFNTGV